MTDLASVTLREIRLPLAEPFETASGIVSDRRVILLELVDRDGASAWSECVAGAAPGYGSETVDGAWTELADSLERGALPEHPMARASIEMGKWALSATRDGKSLASLLTDKPRGRVECGVVIGMQPDPESLAAKVKAASLQGYRRIKLKVTPGRDVEVVRAAIDAAGTSQLAVDANGSYRLDDAAHVAALRLLDSFDLMMIEQPLDATLEEYAKLHLMLRTSICLDETISTDRDACEMIALASATIVNIKPGRVGGLSEAIAIHDTCVKAGVRVWCGGMLETGIGRAYNVALASLPGFQLPGDISPSARYWQRDIITSPWVMSDDGFMNVPLSSPGIGVEPDLDFIDEITVRRGTINRR